MAEMKIVICIIMGIIVTLFCLIVSENIIRTGNAEHKEFKRLMAAIADLEGEDDNW